MENESIFSEIKIDDTAKSHIGSIAKWAVIIALSTMLGFILSLISLLIAPKQSVPTLGEGFGDGTPLAYQQSGGEMTSTIISLIIGMVVAYFLYQFGNLAKKSLITNHTAGLTAAFRNLKNYFVVMTILFILSLLGVLLLFSAAV